MEFIEYEKCSTCKKAKKFLDDRNIDYIDRSITDNNPTYQEITGFVQKYHIPLKKLFNTSGLKYRELNLKEALKDMSFDDKIRLLASDGMLVKRPILVLEDKILLGFKEKEWSDYFKQSINN